MKKASTRESWEAANDEANERDPQEAMRQMDEGTETPQPLDEHPPKTENQSGSKGQSGFKVEVTDTEGRRQIIPALKVLALKVKTGQREIDPSYEAII